MACALRHLPVPARACAPAGPLLNLAATILSGPLCQPIYPLAIAQDLSPSLGVAREHVDRHARKTSNLAQVPASTMIARTKAAP